MTPEQSTEILRLRAAQVGSKQIARQLGLRPAAVNPFIREHAETAYLEKAKSGELQSLQECLINQSAAQWLLKNKARKGNQSAKGLAQIIITRQARNRLLVGSYLVDYWCLGVKNVIPPRKMGSSESILFVKSCAERFAEPFIEISLAQAQSIVYGAIDYAHGLGFEPHRDFNANAQAHLGLRPDSLIPIKFGKDGQPFFMSGPYDDSEKILRTLEASVGIGNFHFIAGLGGSEPDDAFFLE
ncbi:MAG: DNA-binding response regulator [Nodosilinea sp.]